MKTGPVNPASHRRWKPNCASRPWLLCKRSDCIKARPLWAKKSYILVPLDPYCASWSQLLGRKSDCIKARSLQTKKSYVLVDPWTPRGLNQERTGFLVNQERKSYLWIKKKRIPCESKKERIRGTIKRKIKGKKKKGGKNLLLEIKKEDRKRKAYVWSSWKLTCVTEL